MFSHANFVLLNYQPKYVISVLFVSLHLTGMYFLCLFHDNSSTKDILSNVEPGLPSCCYAKRKRRSMTFHDISETKLTRVKRRPGKGSSRSKSSRSPGSKDDEFEISSGSGENEDDDTPELEAAKSMYSCYLIP